MPRTYVKYIVIIKSITKCVIKRWSNSEVLLRQWKIPIISVEIMKTIDERERCDTKCAAMRWSNSEV